MLKRLKVTLSVNYSLLPFWLGIHIQEYGCEGLGHHGIMFTLELGFIEFMLCVGKRYTKEVEHDKRRV
ncbi:hypothetical protein ES708_30795 [subsurface metagenome]